MAMMSFSGMEEILADMNRMGKAAGDTARRMTEAAAEETIKAWKNSAETHGHRKTGAMIDSIGHTAIKEKSGTVTTEVYPQGKDKNGTRNAEKAFILHYGRSNLKGDHWVDDAEAAAEGPATERMEQIWDEMIQGK